ncbi:MAG TPA: lytic murein transglycosylase [Solirubrobacteraceae bacterium]|nr:lytic murein transglycosylase [Solirubrobacteraceae bacterium]
MGTPRTIPPPALALVLAASVMLVCALGGGSAGAAEPQPTPAGPATETTAPAPAPEATTVPQAAPPASPQTETTAVPAPATPQVQTQYSQGITPSTPAKGGRHGAAEGNPGPGAKAREAEEEALRKGARAVSPGTLTPAVPLSLQAALEKLPGFFIESFAVPPFLLPIFQAAGASYGIPWQVLAAINEVETDYGRDLSISSAGAEGWMQFLPSSWTQYGVDANGDGFEDPYNPADAVFAAARYLRAAGGEHNIRGAVFSYNHSQAYVESVMLRAQLLGGTPAELLGAITGLTEGRFPVHAAAHFSDGFPTVQGRPGSPARQLVGTTIYASAGAPVIAVQDGKVAQIGSSAALGRFVVLRDAYGNRYTYAHLGSVASVYPVLTPHVDSTVSRRIESSAHASEPAPSGPATAGVQPRSPLSDGATVSGLANGAAAQLEAAPPAPSAAPTAPPVLAPPPAPPHTTAFRSGSDDVSLHPLRAGVQVIAGTVLGHVGAAAAGTGPHIVFQIRPAGAGAPLIDPKPILDGWVALESSSVFHARGENPFLATSPSTGQVLLESKQQLEPQVLRDGGIHLGRCGRADVQGGRVDKRVLALLEYLAVSGLKPSVGGLSCSTAAPTAGGGQGQGNPTAGESIRAITITAVNGVPVAGHQQAGSTAEDAVRRMLMLQGLARPQRILSLMSFPGSQVAHSSARAADAIRVAFGAAGAARAAGLAGAGISASSWIKLVARLGEIPDPSVSRAPSAAAIADHPSEGAAGGHH